MDGAVTKALRPTDARRLEGILRRLATLWEAPALVDIPVALNARLSRTLGRLVGRPWRIELGPRAIDGTLEITRRTRRPKAAP
jgi:hypothetical protein